MDNKEIDINSLAIKEIVRQVVKEEIEPIKSELKDAVESINKNSQDNIEQDRRIDKLCYAVETLTKNQEDFLKFMSESKGKGGMWLEKLIWILLGAIPSWIASYFFKK